MKTKTLILIAWPASVLLVGWLGAVFGNAIGMRVGMSEFYNQYARRFQLDLADAAIGTDARSAHALRSAANLAGSMGDNARYTAAAEEFVRKLKASQVPVQ